MKRSLALLALLALAGCGPDLQLYQVDRLLTESCEIRSNGEFCDDVGAQAAVVETFGVERDGELTIVYFGEQAWVSFASEGERTITKEDRVTSEPGPCTTIERRTLRFDVTSEQFTGRLDTETRIEGNEACGETPRGTRQSFSLAGTRTNAI